MERFVVIGNIEVGVGPFLPGECDGGCGDMGHGVVLDGGSGKWDRWPGGPRWGEYNCGRPEDKRRAEDNRHAVDERRLDGRRGKNKERQWPAGGWGSGFVLEDDRWWWVQNVRPPLIASCPFRRVTLPSRTQWLQWQIT